METIKDILKDRLNHPFLGTFLFSLIITNWKVLLISTTGDLNPAERIEQILALNLSFKENLLSPALVALVIFIVYPALNAIGNLLIHFVKVIELNTKVFLDEKFDNNSQKLVTMHKASLWEVKAKVVNCITLLESTEQRIKDEGPRHNIRNAFLQLKDLAQNIGSIADSDKHLRIFYGNIKKS